MQSRFDKWYTSLTLNENIGYYVKDRYSVFGYLMGTVPQYCAFVKGEDGQKISRIDAGCGPEGGWWFRPSDSYLRNLALHALLMKLPSFKPQMKSLAFPSKVTKFYEGLTEQTYTCNINGQVHDIVPPCKQDPTKCW